VKTNFVLRVLRVKPAVNLLNEGGGVYDFGREDSNGA
jgi:hypothetical protein